MCVLAAFLDAPLQGPANTESPPFEGIKAPWIFVGVQQALRYFSPFMAGVLAPFAAMLVLACLPYLHASGRRSSQAIKALFFGILLVSISLTLWGYLS